MSRPKVPVVRHPVLERSRFLVLLVCLVGMMGLLPMLLNIVRQRDVGTDTILGGICVYLLFAVIWALVYEIVERVQPGSFGPGSTPTGVL